MADSSGKRFREAKKRQQQEVKANRKRMRKEGLLGHDHSGLFAPGERGVEVQSASTPPPPPPQEQEKPGAP